MMRAIFGLLSLLMMLQTALAGSIDTELEWQLQSALPGQMFDVIISLKTRADTSSITDHDKHRRRRQMLRAMRDHANKEHPALIAFLQANGATAIKPLWIVNSIAARVPGDLLRKLAKRPAVARIYPDASLSAPSQPAAGQAVSEWHLNAIHVPEVWALGFDGSGVVVANLDTGVDGLHPDLAGQYRGGANSWFDPHGQNPTPTDQAAARSGHGTQVMGLMVAGNGGGSAIGSAPGAKWIAGKLFDNQGASQESDFHQNFQWLLDPDNDPQTDDAPDVVNGSFQTASSGICDSRFQADIQSLRSAGIAVVFAAGNGGPAAGGSSPANNPGSFGVGAVDRNGAIAGFSARGPAPAACGGGLLPQLVAPGVDVMTTDLSLGGNAGYIAVSGTSFAAPLVAGAMALLLEAFPGVEVGTLEAALLASAGDLGVPGPENDYGHGLLNVEAAYQWLAASVQNPLGVDDSYQLDEDAVLDQAAPGVLSNDSDPQNDSLSVELVGNVSHGNLMLHADGGFSYIPAANFAGVDGFSYRASDGLHHSGVVSVLLTVNPVNDPPLAQADTAVVDRARSVNIAVLANDSDPENSPLTTMIDSNSVHGSLSLNSDGSVNYRHDGSRTTSDSFSYHINDGQLDSNSATVTIAINPFNAAPIANQDRFLYRPGQLRNVAGAGSLGKGVLANDSDADHDMLAAQLVANSQTGGGTLNLHADGSFDYFRNTAGKAGFRYRADDGQLSSQPASGSQTWLYPDRPPKTRSDHCRYFFSTQSVSEPGRCSVVAENSVKMDLTVNDYDPDAGSRQPSDGVGASVVAGSLNIVAVGSGVTVYANPQCGQTEIASNTLPPRAGLINHCDGSVSVSIANPNQSKTIDFRYRVADDLGAFSSAARARLSVRFK